MLVSRWWWGAMMKNWYLINKYPQTVDKKSCRSLSTRGLNRPWLSLNRSRTLVSHLISRPPSHPLSRTITSHHGGKRPLRAGGRWLKDPTGKVFVPRNVERHSASRSPCRGVCAPLWILPVHLRSVFGSSLCVFVPLLLACRMSGSSWKQMFARLDDLICVERKNCRRPSFLIRDILDEGKLDKLPTFYHPNCHEVIFILTYKMLESNNFVHFLIKIKDFLDNVKKVSVLSRNSGHGNQQKAVMRYQSITP